MVERYRCCWYAFLTCFFDLTKRIVNSVCVCVFSRSRRARLPRHRPRALQRPGSWVGSTFLLYKQWRSSSASQGRNVEVFRRKVTRWFIVIALRLEANFIIYSKSELVRFLSVTIKTRLLMLQPYLNQWPQAIALLSKPSNAPHALSNLMTLVDDICYHAGDRSIDVRKPTNINRHLASCGLLVPHYSFMMYLLH